MTVRIEICVDDVEGLKAAVEGGADRIELCAALGIGGLTPTPGLMLAARDCGVPVRAMIRPRSGDFRYTRAEAETMLADIDAVRRTGLAGVVIGASDGTGALDGDLLRRLTERAEGMEIALHRVVDLLFDPVAAVQVAIDLGHDTILTSGGARTAGEGARVIRHMVQAAADRIEILPGSGVTALNAGELLAATGARSLHASCGAAVAVTDPRTVELGFAGPAARRTLSDLVIALRRAVDA